MQNRRLRNRKSKRAMNLKNNLFRTTLALGALALQPLSLNAQQVKPPATVQRKFQPEDLFRIRQVGDTAWSGDGRYAAIEFTRPGREIAETVPSTEIELLDVNARTLRPLSSNAPAYIGFFNAV